MGKWIISPCTVCISRSMEHIIHHTKPSFDFRETQCLKSVMLSRNVNEGEHSANLIDTISEMVGARGGVPSSTGTLGLHLALKVLGIESEQDEVIIPDFACRSLYDCVRMAGGTPVFCDINLDDYSLEIDSVTAAICPKTKAIILPHMYGCPADIDSFLGLGIPVIEDCAHSLGAVYKGRAVGGLGTISLFSFEGSKIIAAGEGGVVLSRENKYTDRLRELRQGQGGNFAYHYRLSDLTAAVAMVQIGKLPSMIKKRREIAHFYNEKLHEFEIRGMLSLPQLFSDRESVFYRYVVVCQNESSELIHMLNNIGILARNPLPSGRLSDNFEGVRTSSPSAQSLVSNGLSLPIYPDLTTDEMGKVVNAMASFLKDGGI